MTHPLQRCIPAVLPARADCRQQSDTCSAPLCAPGSDDSGIIAATLLALVVHEMEGGVAAGLAVAAQHGLLLRRQVRVQRPLAGQDGINHLHEHHSVSTGQLPTSELSCELSRQLSCQLLPRLHRVGNGCGRPQNPSQTQSFV